VRTPYRKLIPPLILLAALALLMHGLPALARSLGLGLNPGNIGRLDTGLAALAWLSAALLLIRLLDVLLWQGVVVRRTGIAPPRLLTNLVDVLVWLTTLVIITSYVFNQPVTGLVTTSGVAVATVGFALKSLISDMFSGIALTLERPFNIGDWVQIADGTVGRVAGISWRATNIVLQNGVTVHIPNGRMAELILHVFNEWRDEIDIELGYGMDEEQAERILLSAVSGLPDLGPQFRPDARIVAFGTNGVMWRLRYWLPDYPSRSDLRAAVHHDLLRAMHVANVTTAPIQQHILFERFKPEEVARHDTIAAFLRRIDLFKLLTHEECQELAEGLTSRKIAAGAMVVRQGESGDSLFLIREGTLEVLVGPAGHVVAQLTPGSFFGEMSLLTGAPRSASVRARTSSVLIEVSKERLQPIISRREMLAEELSRILAERQQATTRLTSASDAGDERLGSTRFLSGEILARVRSFFGLANPQRTALSA
jgi:small-conductance mechanosensitive channel/CRP-like cAMP-binding protein